MKKKYTLSFLIIISLSFSGMMICVLGQTTYTCKVSVGDQAIGELLEVDEYHSRTMLEGELGAKRKYQVSNVTEKADCFLVEVKVWDTIAANEAFNPNSDFTDVFNVTKDPAKLPSSSVVLLSPVNSYLSEYVLASPWNVTSSGNTLVSYYWPYTYYYTFDSNGMQSEMKVTNNTAVLERWGSKGQSSTIPGYDLSIVIGLTTVAVLSLVYILKKKILK